MSVKTSLLDREDPQPAEVIKGKLRSSAKVDVAPRRHFILFATLFEANMIDRDLRDKKISFEISIGKDFFFIPQKRQSK